ncbi:MAG: KpsF/GutQ family sugar-phosphate isomerase [Oleispira sp.]|nr:KpsF/GutQ family sugar-phosphate isomerase [Oleispira sp.]
MEQLVSPEKGESSPLGSELTAILQNVFTAEASAIAELAKNMPSGLELATEMISKSNAVLIVAGIGKSGHIAKKIASTLCSLGTRAVFLHAAEASHGDLGIIERDSIVLVLSNSGETPELGDLLAYCNANGNSVIGLTARAESSLGRASKICLSYNEQKEACINGLAPTVSTTAALAVGDALAVGASYLAKREPEDFRRFHPGGKLGAQLKTVREIMRTQDLPIVKSSASMTEVIITMSAKTLGVAIVEYGEGAIKLITDGDLRRHSSELWQATANDIVNQREPISIDPDRPASYALSLMEAEKINCLLVIDPNHQLCGLVTIHDCLRAGIQA